MIKTTNVVVIDKDRGFKELVRRLQESGRELAVGLPEKVGSTKHPNAEMTLAQLGTIHEFGDGEHIPARPFISGTIDANAVRYERAMKTVGDDILTGKSDVDTALSKVGEIIVGDIKKNIANGIPPPNADSTIKRKGSSTPLVDSGHLRNSITYDVRKARVE